MAPCECCSVYLYMNRPCVRICLLQQKLYLWIPEHCIQRVMPKLMLAQRGSGWPQSQQQALPGIARTFCRALSPFSDLSFVSPLESRLPVDVDDFLSSFWWERDGEYTDTQRHGKDLLRSNGNLTLLRYSNAFFLASFNYPLSFSACFLPRRHLPCRGRRWRCCSGRLWSRPVAASLSLPASYSSCWDMSTSHNCCLLNMLGGGYTVPPPSNPFNIFQCVLHSLLLWLMTLTYLVGDTTSKQKRRSMSSQCLTVHSLRSSTTTVGLSCGDSTAALVKTNIFVHFTFMINANTFEYIQLYSDCICNNYTQKHIFSNSWGEEFVLKAHACLIVVSV